MSDDDENEERAKLAADARMSTLTPQQTVEMLKNSYERRSHRDRAREAWRKAQEKKNGTG